VVEKSKGLAPGNAYSVVADTAMESVMLRECNAQLVVSEQSIRNECNNLRRQLLQIRVVLNEILAEHAATSREASEIGHSDGLWLKPSLFQAATKLVNFLKNLI
jgi:hypothetical protein